MRTQDYYNKNKFQLFIEALKIEKALNELKKDEQLKSKVKNPELPFSECKTCAYNINGVCLAGDITDCAHYNN